jgi:hypothetical protein
MVAQSTTEISRMMKMSDIGGPITLCAVICIIASVGIGAGADSDKWWVPLLGGFVIIPVLGVVVIALMIGLDTLWGKGKK